jgi:hypothetical protein
MMMHALAHSRFEPGDFSIAKRSQTGSKGNRIQRISCDRRLGEDRLKLPSQSLERFSPALTGCPSPEHHVDRHSKRSLEPVTCRGV